MSAEKRTIDGLTVIEAPPDAPLPENVPSWAERCDVVETPNISPAVTPWMAGAGAAGTLGSVVTLAFFSHWGMASLPLSLALLWLGLRPGTTTTVTPSSTGRYLAYENPVDEEGSAISAVLLVIGVVMLLVAIALLATHGSWEAIVVLATFGGGLFHRGLASGEPRREDGELPSTLRFRALADPSRFHTAHDPLAPRLSPPAGDAAPPNPSTLRKDG